MWDTAITPIALRHKINKYHAPIIPPALLQNRNTLMRTLPNDGRNRYCGSTFVDELFHKELQVHKLGCTIGASSQRGIHVPCKSGTLRATISEHLTPFGKSLHHDGKFAPLLRWPAYSNTYKYQGLIATTSDMVKFMTLGTSGPGTIQADFFFRLVIFYEYCDRSQIVFFKFQYLLRKPNADLQFVNL